MNPTDIINKTGRAVIAIAVMVFCCSTIVWLLLYGSALNSLHLSALSWSYTVMCVSMAALGLNVTVDKLIQIFSGKPTAP